MSASTPDLLSQPGILPGIKAGAKADARNVTFSPATQVTRKVFPAIITNKQEAAGAAHLYASQLFQKLVGVVFKRGISLSESFDDARFVSSGSLAKFLGLILEVDNAHTEVKAL
jgi:hypothetical protein